MPSLAPGISVLHSCTASRNVKIAQYLMSLFMASTCLIIHAYATQGLRKRWSVGQHPLEQYWRELKL